MATQSNTRRLLKMTRLLVISLCILSVSFIAAELTCPEGEIVNNCPTPCRTTCPKSEKEAKESCPTPDTCPEPACQCRYFERRADNGTCINTRQCPPFDCSARPNERFDPCPALCPTEDCSQASLKGKCPSRIGNIGIVLICNPACRCIKDHYRKDGICVPEAECGNGTTTTVRPKEESQTPPADDTQNVETQTLEISPSGEISEANALATSDSTDKAELTCPEGEIVNNCPTPCKTTCPKSEKEAKKLCPKPDPCPEPACQCRYFERRADNGTCINTRQCPPFDCSARPNERFDPCPAYCPTEDCSPPSLKGRCPFLLGVVLICNPACRCIKDHYRKDGICVPEAECGNGTTTTVRPKEESQTPPADDTQDVETQTLEISPSGEISGANALATSDSTDKAKKCGPNEEYSCRKSCPPDTCASNVIRCANDPTEVCKGGCYCKGGFLRANKTAPCTPQCDCENIANTDLCKPK